MAGKPSPGPLPCLFCGMGFPSSEALTAHLDIAHGNWVHFVLGGLGLSCPERYPIEEYRRALVEAILDGEIPVSSD